MNIENMFRTILIMMIFAPGIYNLLCAGNPNGVNKFAAVIVLAVSIMGFIGAKAVF